MKSVLADLALTGVVRQLDIFKLKLIKKTNEEGIISSQKYFAPAKELIAGCALSCPIH